MRRRSRTLSMLSCVPFVLLGAACVDDEGGCDAADVPEHGENTIVVEGDPWSGYAPFRDEENPLLQDTGNVTLYVEQLCQEARAADVTAGRADVILTSLDQYLLHQPEGTVVGVVDQSIGADALVLNTKSPGLEYLDSVEDLSQLVRDFAEDGKKPVLAYTGNSPSEMLLDELSNTYEELRLDDFDLVSVDQSSSAYDMLQNERAQLAVLWEPDVSDAVANGYTKALSSSDVPDSIVDVLVASNRFVEHDETALRTLLGEFYARMDEYLADENLTEFEQLVATDGGLTPEQADNVVAGMRLYGSAQADAFMNHDEYPIDQPQLEQSIDSIGSLLALVHPGVDPENARFDGRYVQELTQ